MGEGDGCGRNRRKAPFQRGDGKRDPNISRDVLVGGRGGGPAWEKRTRPLARIELGQENESRKIVRMRFESIQEKNRIEAALELEWEREKTRFLTKEEE